MKPVERVAAVSLAVALSSRLALHEARDVRHWLHLTQRIAIAPIAAWPSAAHDGGLAGALWGLVPTTLAWAVPLSVYLRRGDQGCLVAACLMWAMVGFLLGVAIWV